MCKQHIDNRFSSVGSPERIWTVSAIHANINRLVDIHDELFERINPGDRIIYLGNYTGFGDYAFETVDELLTFRRLILAQQGMKASDIVYLRGGQEEMWHRLTQLQFDPNPADTLLWMIGNGMGATLQNYGICAHDGIIAARQGVIPLTRWTQKVRETLREHAGHECFFTHCKRAAYTSHDDRFPTLFVNAGIDPSVKLEHQKDALWWSEKNFNDLQKSYDPFDKVVRGFDPRHEGLKLKDVTASLDGGCGFGGSLICAGMDVKGELFELMEA